MPVLYHRYNDKYPLIVICCYLIRPVTMKGVLKMIYLSNRKRMDEMNVQCQPLKVLFDMRMRTSGFPEAHEFR